MTGGGIGIDYSVYRGSGEILRGTGGVASGPIPKMQMINEILRDRIAKGKGWLEQIALHDKNVEAEVGKAAPPPSKL